MKYPKKNSKGELVFKNYPKFRPNITPIEMFTLGSFGGTYWRPIYSNVVDKELSNIHLNYPKTWWKDIPDNMLINSWDNYDININKYKVEVGTTLEYWQEKEWIRKNHPYGWVHWYCDFYMGKRSDDDEWQINRWVKTAGPNSRFRKRLINMIKDKNTKYNDYTVSPKIRQTLQHWGYQLTKNDLNK